MAGGWRAGGIVHREPARRGGHLGARGCRRTLDSRVCGAGCACCPWPVLGLRPVWCRSAPCRSRAVAEPSGVLADFGVSLPKDVEIRVWDSTAETRFLVLPMRPPGTDGWSEQQLAELVTRDSTIGTGFAKTTGTP